MNNYEVFKNMKFKNWLEILIYLQNIAKANNENLQSISNQKHVLYSEETKKCEVQKWKRKFLLTD